MSTPFKRLLEEATAGRRVSDVAKSWGVPAWLIYDGLYEHTKTPSARYLPAVARGLGLTVESLLEKLSPQEVPV